MKKWLLLYLLLPFVAFAQNMNIDLVPYKSTFSHFFYPKEYNYSIDTLNTGYSTLHYHSFSSKGQFIKVNHQQFINDYILFNLNFDKFSQEGIFNRENLKLHNISTNLLFNNKRQTYSAKLTLGYQKFITDENGGLLNFSDINFDDPLLYQVSLLNAQNEVKNRNHKLVQKFKLTDKRSIINKLSILSNRKIYSDNFPNSGFYQNLFIDSIQTFDSLSNIAITNSFGITFNNFILSQLFHKRHAHINTIDSTDFDYGLSLNYFNYRRSLSFSSELYKSNDLNFSLKKIFNLKLLNHTLSLDYDRSRVPILINSYYSNHYRFDNDFNNIKIAKATYFVKYKNYSFISYLIHYSDYVYLNQDSHYQQYQKAIIKLYNKLTINLNWKKFHTTQTIEYQYADNTSIIRFPEFNYNTSLWIESNLFSDNLNTQIGADMNYFTSYYAMAYNPALAKFYLQDNQLIGDVPLISVFLKLKVHNMFICMRYRNIISLINTNADVYYLIPNYPNYPASFQLSVVWKLNNTSD
ncbi:MAG: hypothetical protein CMP70_02660 [Flavobacteriales bacterium]|nr:hypothetical protein [Flavobacteriales bacterium]|tara:strand:+ start:280 stop:1845 length:1566 start_codon:yes stop_codon:yes gene_type:complete